MDPGILGNFDEILGSTDSSVSCETVGPDLLQAHGSLGLTFGKAETSQKAARSAKSDDRSSTSNDGSCFMLMGREGKGNEKTRLVVSRAFAQS